MTFKARIHLVNQRFGGSLTVQINVDPRNLPSKEELDEILKLRGFPAPAWKPIGVGVVRSDRGEEVCDPSTIEVEEELDKILGTRATASAA